MARAKAGDDGPDGVAAEAEQSVLGGLLLDAAPYAEIAKFLAAGDFADPLHAELYRAIGALLAAGQAVDPIAVADRLERDEAELDYKAARAYLGKLAADCPGTHRVVHHAKIVRERAIERHQRAAELAGGREAAKREARNGRLFAPDGTPVVRWIEGNLPDVVDQAEAALIEGDFGIYQRDRMLVRITKRAEPSLRNYKRPPGVLGIQAVTLPYFTETLTRCALWERWDNRSQDWRRTNAPEKVAATYLDRVAQWKVPRLWDTISAPTLRPDGTLLQQPGYDEATHVYYDPCGVKYPPILDEPDVDTAREAYRLLRETFGSFPFETEVDRAVSLAAVLTALVRRSLPSAPLIAISAPVPNSGKTLLADGIAIVAMGSTAPVMTFAETDEEAKKTALAVLMEGDPVVLIDNVERPLEGDWLCSILTSEVYRQRVLGRTEMMTVPTRMLWLATGNHIQVVKDLRSRTLLCRIDAKLENPGERVFPEDFRKHIITRRPELVAAGLTLMRAFIATRQRVDDFIPPWGRFERWSEMVRAPLVWMECADPCESIKTLEAKDPLRGEHLRLVTLWWECFGSRPQTARDVIDWLKLNGGNTFGDKLHELLQEIVVGKDGNVSNRRLGRWLEGRLSARVSGYQIEQAGERDHSALWKVTKEGSA